MGEQSGAAVEATLHSSAGTGVVRMSARYETSANELWSALTDRKRLAEWYGRVEGDLREGGEFTAFVYGSEWDGRGRVEACDSPRQFGVTMWEEGGAERPLVAALAPEGDRTRLEIEIRGLPLDLVWAFGAGWQVHLESLAAHLEGRTRADSDARMEELVPNYRAMPVVPLEG